MNRNFCGQGHTMDANEIIDAWYELTNAKTVRQIGYCVTGNPIIGNILFNGKPITPEQQIELSNGGILNNIIVTTTIA